MSEKRYVKPALVAGGGLLALLAAAFSVELWREQKAESPHYRAGACLVCHVVEGEPGLKANELELCTACHEREGALAVENAEGVTINVDLGVSHPWGMVPFGSRPASLPLNDGRVTCQTCHDVHQDNAVNRMVRLGIGRDFTALCHDCHPDY